ncbi:MAG TPA: NAD(+) diphosphatase [Myxococcaceae bacterium]|nr:NAD(+) diphosphatase [Myxococcaceae bacterium]
MARPFVPMLAPPASLSSPAGWFIYRGGQLLVRADGERRWLPRALSAAELGIPLLRTQFLGELGGEPFFAAEMDEALPIPEGHLSENLRGLYGRLQDEEWSLAGRAFQLIDFDRTHQFCGRCGERTEQPPTERAKRCPRCGLLAYPRVAPAVIVLIRRGREALLARGKRFPLPFYSTLAGFVEPGESLEEALAREVMEEVGIAVKDLRYFGSQPWPFPHSLMIGFNAEYAGGELTLDPSEILDAAWFTADNLPQIPGKLSIARKLIDHWLAEQGRASPQGGR